MPRLHHSSFLTSLLVLLFGGALLAIAPARAQLPPACPGLAVTLSTKPAIRKAGGPLLVQVKVRNTGATALSDVGLRVTVPLNVKYNKLTVHPGIKGSDGTSNPLALKPQVFWPLFSLDAGKGRTFRLRGALSKCQEGGSFDIKAAAYILSRNCSSAAAPRPATVRDSRWPNTG